MKYLGCFKHLSCKCIGWLRTLRIRQYNSYRTGLIFLRYTERHISKIRLTEALDNLLYYIFDNLIM